MKVTIIAEAGVNHNGNLGIAFELIDAAASAGADYVKFQTFKAENLVTKSAQKAEYQKINCGELETQFEMIKRLELSVSMHIELIEHCRKRGIEFLSTGFDIESLEFLVGLDMPILKIPSGEITNLPYLRYIGGLGKPLIVSTGMATIDEVESAINALEMAGTPRNRITVLHCTTSYPTAMQDVNLLAMQTLRDRLGVWVGYSDHTKGIEVPIAAVALGASVIEKHFTLDRNLNGPDHKASLEPDELAAMVTAIRNIEIALGDGVKRPKVSESSNAAVARKSIVAADFIACGEIFSASNLAVKRPGTGISPMRWDDVLGKIAQRDYQKDELIEL